MEKPKDYGYYTNSRNHIPHSQWPEDVKKYHNWKRDIRIHPEWKDLSDEEFYEVKKKAKNANALKSRERMMQAMGKKTPEEMKKINEKKGSWHKKLSEEEKKKNESW